MRVGVFAVVVLALLAALSSGATSFAKPRVLKVKPPSVQFGIRPVGSFTLGEAVIKNRSSRAIHLLVTVARMPDDFSFGLLPGSTCPPFEPAPIEPGESCSAVVGFRPSEFFAGEEQLAQLEATATDPVTGEVLESVLIDFTGTGE